MSEGQPSEGQNHFIPPDNQRRYYGKQSRFRSIYRDLTLEESRLVEQIQSKAEEMVLLFERAGAGRYRALATTSLEESVMWITKEIST